MYDFVQPRPLESEPDTHNITTRNEKGTFEPAVWRTEVLTALLIFLHGSIYGTRQQQTNVPFTYPITSMAAASSGKAKPVTKTKIVYWEKMVGEGTVCLVQLFFD